MDKSIHKTVGNIMKYWPDQLFQQLAGELIVQAKLYFTGLIAQRYKPPMAVQMPKRPVLQGHVDLMRRRTQVFGSEMLLDMVVIDVYRGMHRRALQLGNARSAAPRQELRVLFHAIYQIKHPLRAVRNQYRFLNQSYCK